ncbi:hypothetical protein OX284_007710 [Flavobacterium sp. SUN046]|uniref:hypothetical protein n=1 Tax=Flavobacterium sp. SUN046 TaxID=3002440 RepID=UPI002DB7EF03|nr:hypothetical protein [Flavobacterium sp. SUN046]MEC4049313.1 hypothetical protein [Flavobacterium sp. SUN046]
MKSTQWIKEKLNRVNSELKRIDNLIKEKNIQESDLINTKLTSKDGSQLEVTIDQRINSLVGQKIILEEILQ